MVKERKSLSAGHGINSWLQQRITAVLMLVAIVVLFVFMVLANQIIDANFITWQQFFSFTFVKIFTQITILGVVLHAWIGMRDVVMDYVKSYSTRVTFYTMIIVWLVGCFIYSAVILWA
jgi:succinate dehydrogenase / fumarate reductase membrane anchor subunit